MKEEENDRADQLDDLICTFEKATGVFDGSAFALLSGWFVFALTVFVICHILYKTIDNSRSKEDDVVIKTNNNVKKETEIISNNENPINEKPKCINSTTEIIESKLEDEKNSSDDNNVILTNTCDEISESPIKSVTEKVINNIPTTSGSDKEAVDWVNESLTKVFGQAESMECLKSLWLKSLSDYSKSSGIDHANEIIFGSTHLEEEAEGVYNISMKNTLIYSEGVQLEFENLSSDHGHRSTPILSNLITQSHPNDNFTITGDLESSDISFNVSCILLNNCESERDKYLIKVERLRGRINLAVLNHERLVIAKLDGWPEVRIKASKFDFTIPTSSTEQDSSNILTLIEDLTISAIRGAQININMEDFYDGSVFPIFTRKSMIKNQEIESKVNSLPPSSPTPSKLPVSYQLSVRIVKADKLINAIEPYVIIEIDEPSQKYSTHSNESHIWNADFSCDLNDRSTEVLFEVWDAGHKLGGTDMFLGLGIVAVEELLITPSQRHVIPLQGRPFQENHTNEGGLLTVQFVLIDVNLNKVVTMDTKKSFIQNVSSPESTLLSFSDGDQVLNNDPQTEEEEDSQSLLVRRESYIRATRFGKNDLVSGANEEKKPKSALKKYHQSSQFDPSLEFNNNDQNNSGIGSGEVSFSRRLRRNGFRKQRHLASSTPQINDMESTETEESVTLRSARGRKTKKRNLISTFKKRFTGRRSASMVMDSNGGKRDESTDRKLRSISADRAYSYSDISTTASYLTVPTGEDNSSNLSDMSTFSAASGATYIAEESSLVIEVIQAGTKRYYLIPHEIALNGKYKIRGTKLHIYMDHIFTAKHINGIKSCDVCYSRIPIRIGKQAYCCRDCNIVCHKPCHIKVPTHCLETSLPSLDILRENCTLKNNSGTMDASSNKINTNDRFHETKKSLINLVESFKSNRTSKWFKSIRGRTKEQGQTF